MRSPIVGGEGGVHSARPVPLLLLLLVLLSAVGPAIAQTPDLSGDYYGDLTFSDVTPPCIDASIQGALTDWDMEVQARDTSNVDITFINLPSNGVDTVFNASLNSNLEAFAEHDNGWTIVGQFAGTGTDVSFNGRVQWTQECPIDSANTRQPVPQSFTVQANRVSAGDEIQASPSPPSTDDLVAIDLAEAALEQECPSEELDSDHCSAAFEYADEWKIAMARDRGALRLDPTSDAAAELGRLQVIMGYAATLGGLLSGGPTALVPLYPVVHGLLPVFGHLFVQGVSEAATGRIDELRNTVGRAEKLLALALSGAETRRATVG